MINKQHFTELKAKYNVRQNGIIHSGSSFLYFILAKADIDVNLLNDVDWNWLIDNNFLATCELLEQKKEEKLEQKKEEKENRIKKLAQETFSPIYNKYIYLFTSTPHELLGFKYKFNTEYAIKALTDTEYAIKALTGLCSSILFKLDSFGCLNLQEIDYLKKNNLAKTKNVKLLENFLRLKNKYNITQYASISSDDPLYSILCKLNEGLNPLTNKEVEFLKTHIFSRALKTYTEQEEIRIKKKLDKENQLINTEIIFLKENHLNDLLEKYNKQENKRQEEFIKLKEKYLATPCLETSLNSPLYKILQNIEAGKTLQNDEINWLNTNNLNDAVTIADFVALKIKYKATKNQDLSLSSHLYKILKKIGSNIPLPESDINFLKKKQLIETLNITIDQYANHLISQIESGQELNEAQLQWIEKNTKQDVINLGKTKHFKNLKRKYQVDQFSDTSPEIQLYLILQKLDQNQRLDATQIAYLQDKNLFYSETKIYIAYHTIEAQFYEVDYQKTGNKWNIPNISSHWRKADQPKKALKATENIIKDFDHIKENKLKAAILTTRGGAFRDIPQLDNAEKCARQAIEFQPSSHHPYTLMGAICFDRYDRYEGEKWFEKAIERGASRESIDVEIKKSVARMKDQDKRDQMIRDLLKKDSRRYSWANKYLSKNSHKKLG